MIDVPGPLSILDYLKAFSLGGTWSEVTSRVAGFNLVIILDPVQPPIKMSAELRLVKMKIELSNILNRNCMRFENIKDFGYIELSPCS